MGFQSGQPVDQVRRGLFASAARPLGRVAERKVKTTQPLSDAAVPISQGAEGDLLQKLATKFFRLEVEPPADVQERKRPALVVRDDPAVGVEVNPLLSGGSGIAIAAQIAPGLEQDARGKFVFGFGNARVFGGVHVWD